MRMTKVIEIRKAGFVWNIDLDVVAKNRAEHYKDESETSYDEEYKYTMEDDYEGIDWYLNNMDWDMIPVENKRLVKSPNVKEPDDIDDDVEFEIDIVEAA